MRLIDADALLKEINNYYGDIHKDNFVLNIISDAPTVQREGWVSVEDRLPDVKDEYYLFGGYTHTRWESATKHWSSHDGANKRMIERDGFTHWQPIPAAPKE